MLLPAGSKTIRTQPAASSTSWAPRAFGQGFNGASARGSDAESHALAAT